MGFGVTSLLHTTLPTSRWMSCLTRT